VKSGAARSIGDSLRKQAHATAVLPESNNALTTQPAAVVLAVGLSFGVGVIYEWGPLNGFPNLTKWAWPWQDLGTLQIGLALLAPFLLIAGVLLIVNRSTSRVPAVILLGALVVAQFCLQLFSVLADPRGLERITQIVSSPDATAYLTDALRIQNLHDWMSHLHQANLTGHARFHPAGPILFYYAFARMFGPEGESSELVEDVVPVFDCSGWWREGRSWAAGLGVLRAMALALAVAASLYLVLWVVSGYDPMGALRHSLKYMEAGNQSLGRSYKVSVFADLYDFVLGTGIIAVPILVVPPA
jgi:hypothetical protein